MKLSVGRCFFNALKMDGGETCSLVCIYSPHSISTATNEALTQTAPTAISRSEPRPFTTCPPDNTEKVFFLGSNQAGPPVLDGETYRLSPRDRDGDIDLLSLFFFIVNIWRAISHLTELHGVQAKMSNMSPAKVVFLFAPHDFLTVALFG